MKVHCEWAPDRRAAFLLLTMVTLVACAAPQEDDPPASDAEALIAASIGFHDPDGAWYARPHVLDLAEKRPDGSVRNTSVRFDPVAGSFGMRQDRSGQRVEAFVDADNCAASVDGAVPDSTQASRWRLSCPDGPSWWREYYAFMHGLPMKLADPGTLVDPAVEDMPFMGRDSKRIRVTYDPAVGSDIWYFYFDPASTELIGARFYHDEAANDGEYIQFEGLVSSEGMQMVRTIHWYTNSEGRYLGSDSLMTYRTE